jgi:hypothetical protein
VKAAALIEAAATRPRANLRNIVVLQMMRRCMFASGAVAVTSTIRQSDAWSFGFAEIS